MVTNYIIVMRVDRFTVCALVFVCLGGYNCYLFRKLLRQSLYIIIILEFVLLSVGVVLLLLRRLLQECLRNATDVLWQFYVFSIIFISLLR